MDRITSRKGESLVEAFGGAMIFRVFQVGSRFVLLVLALAFIRTADAQKQASRSPHGPLAIPCENCHTNTSWAPIRAVPEFSHDSTRYPLRGMHEKVYCTECHFRPVFTDVGKNCADCHADIHRRQFGANCVQCHTVNGWNVSVQAVQNHFNRFPLIGAHAVVQCEECHKGAAVGQFVGLSTACLSCHSADLQKTATIGASVPNHLTANFPATCETCHSVDTWLNAKFDHNAVGFPLTAGHANVPCASCHINNNYNLTTAATDCGNSGCHLTTWQQTNNPAHATAPAVFPLATCFKCHTTASWTTATFDHNSTAFPLTGAHVSVACNLCHVGGNFTSTPTTCGSSGCHLTTWQQTTTPVHSTAGSQFAAANCAVCHTTASWATAGFDHSGTGFALTGMHVSPSPTPCISCHVNNNYTLNSAACYGCHVAAWQSTATLGGAVPNHITGAFPQTCETCHTTASWTGAVFDHATTGFALTGMHVSPSPTPCISCHVSNNYTLNSAACYGCHVAAWQSTATLGGAVPNHITGAFPQTCESCHTTSSWTGAVFDHTTTGFALTGMHVSPVPTPCISCHVGNNYTLNSAACYGCHVAAWQSTATFGGAVPNHITAGFPQDCSICHSTANWTSATFNHNTTAFPLTGAHTTVACALCHVGGNYTTVATDCYSCHLTQWLSTVTLAVTSGSVPNHIASNYPTTCASCHTTTSWLGAVFNHSTTGFPLTGFHTTVACALCHISTAVPPIDCYGCHAADYNGTTNPVHATAGFPTTCATCHTTTAWTGAVFNHTWFPETHGGANSVCATCHTNPANYTVFQCTQCHGGGVAANFHHPNVGNYVYNSINCYQCHPRGNGG